MAPMVLLLLCVGPMERGPSVMAAPEVQRAAEVSRQRSGSEARGSDEVEDASIGERAPLEPIVAEPSRTALPTAAGDPTELWRVRGVTTRRDAVDSTTIATEPVASPEEKVPDATSTKRKYPRLERWWFDAGVSTGLPGVSTFYYYGGFGRAAYFMLPHFGASLELLGIGVGDYGVFHSLEVTPELVYVARPRRRFTPVVSAGMGFSSFGDDRGIFPRWTAQAELRVNLFWHITLGIGADLSGLFPETRAKVVFRERGGLGRSAGVHVRPIVALGFRGRRPERFFAAKR